MNHRSIRALLPSLLALVVLPAAAELTIVDTAGDHLDVRSDGKTVVRYMYAHDTSTPGRHHETYKPYLHVFDAEGKAPITKGAGGKFTHHRGIFIGWNKIGFGGKTYDRWHMKGGDIVHQKFSREEVTDEGAEFSSLTTWQTETGAPILEEERRIRVQDGRDGIRAVIDFTTELQCKHGAVSLKGDPEHAGVQYRPANEVDVKKTIYLFPEEGIDPRKSQDLHWVAESYTLKGKRHSVVHMNHPGNPKGTKYSAYRDYGRFGAFFQKDLADGEVLKLRYRFLIMDGELPDRQVIEKEWKAWVAE